MQAVPQVVLTDPVRVPVQVQVRVRARVRCARWRGSSERGVDQFEFEFGPTTIRAGVEPVRVRIRSATNSNNNHTSNRHDPQQRRTGTNQASNKAINLLKASALRSLIFAADTCFIGIRCAAGGGHRAPPKPPRTTKPALHLKNPRLPRNPF